MKHKYAHFLSFSHLMIIDFESIMNKEIFNYNDVSIKLHIPYKSYPYNYDFEAKPKHYILPNKKIKRLPQSKNIAVYPIYSKNYENLGMTIHESENYDLINCQKMKYQNKTLPEKLPNFEPVDTIRFDSDKVITNDTPKFISEFIGHLRNNSGQWWLGKDKISSNNVTIEGISSFNGTINNFTFHSGLIRILELNNGKPINSKIWKETIKNVSEKKEIDLARSLFLDAIYEEAQINYRGVVLNLANAIDITINKYFIEISNIKKPILKNFERHNFVISYRKNKKISSTYIPGLISEFTNELVSRNYKEEFPDKHEIIKRFWLEKRNPVAHGSLINFEKDEIKTLLDTTEHLLNWINSLQYEN